MTLPRRDPNAASSQSSLERLPKRFKGHLRGLSDTRGWANTPAPFLNWDVGRVANCTHHGLALDQTEARRRVCSRNRRRNHISDGYIWWHPRQHDPYYNWRHSWCWSDAAPVCRAMGSSPNSSVGVGSDDTALRSHRCDYPSSRPVGAQDLGDIIIIDFIFARC